MAAPLIASLLVQCKFCRTEVMYLGFIRISRSSIPLDVRCSDCHKLRVKWRREQEAEDDGA